MKLAISESIVKTVSQTIKANITDKNGLTVTYDFSKSKDSDIILQTSLVAKEDDVLSFTKIPEAASHFIPDDYIQSLKKGGNSLQAAEKMQEII